MKRIVWTEAAKDGVRRLNREVAMRILAALHRFAESGALGSAESRQFRDSAAFSLLYSRDLDVYQVKSRLSEVRESALHATHR